MGKHKELTSKATKYYLPKEDYLTAIHYALRYPTLLAELPPADSGKAIDYSKEKVQSSSFYDATSELAIRRQEVLAKIILIESTIKETAGGLDYYLKLAVCYGLTFDQLNAKGMPMCRRSFYEMRRHFYFELIKKI